MERSYILPTPIPLRLWLRLQLRFWFSLGHKRSYNSAYCSNSDSDAFSRCNLTWVSNSCKAGPISLSSAPIRMNYQKCNIQLIRDRLFFPLFVVELLFLGQHLGALWLTGVPRVRNAFWISLQPDWPMNKVHSWGGGGGAEQGFWRCFTDGLNQKSSSVCDASWFLTGEYLLPCTVYHIMEIK